MISETTAGTRSAQISVLQENIVIEKLKMAQEKKNLSKTVEIGVPTAEKLELLSKQFKK